MFLVITLSIVWKLDTLDASLVSSHFIFLKSYRPVEHIQTRSMFVSFSEDSDIWVLVVVKVEYFVTMKPHSVKEG